MFNKVFNHVNLLSKAMDASWTRQEVISHNIANAETPGYKAQHVEFEAMFRQALEGNNGLETKTTRPGHIKAVTGDPLAVRPAVVSETHHSMRMDENNVDVDREMVELAQNTIQYNELINKVNMEFSRLRVAITGNR